MKCPYCGKFEDKVIDSRETREGAATRRRRECLACKRRFTTYEEIEDVAYMVVKKDGRRERFNRAKLLDGLMKACEKRPVETPAVERIVGDIESLMSERVDREMQATDIGTFVMKRLRELDKVAYVRFASVYKDFQDPEEFVREIHGMLTGAKSAASAPAESNGNENGAGAKKKPAARRKGGEANG